jgi:type I restriction enzyme, S subunit
MADDHGLLTLGDVVTLQRGTTYQSALLGQPGPVLLGLASIQRNGGFRDDNLKTYGGDSPEKLILRPGDIYVSLKDVTQSADLLGAIARVPPHIKAGRVTQDTVKLSFRRKDISSRYVYWLLRTPAYREYCRAHAIGTTNLSIAREDFLAFPVPRPNADQLTLVETLDALDDKAELNRRMNATLEAMARALFQSWFVDFDPVRAKLDDRRPSGLDAAARALFPAAFQESVVGSIPKGWSIGKVSDFALLSRDGIDPGDFPTETFDHYSLPAFDAARAPKTEQGSAIMSNKLVVSPDAVLISKLNPHIPRIWLPDLHATRRSVCSTEFMVACPKAGYSQQYLFSLFTSSSFASVYGTLATGTTGSHQRVAPESLLSMRIAIPPVALIGAFTDITKPLFDRINGNIKQSATLAAARDTLLRRLVSGNSRMPAVA